MYMVLYPQKLSAIREGIGDMVLRQFELSLVILAEQRGFWWVVRLWLSLILCCFLLGFLVLRLFPLPLPSEDALLLKVLTLSPYAHSIHGRDEQAHEEDEDAFCGPTLRPAVQRPGAEDAPFAVCRVVHDGLGQAVAAETVPAVLLEHGGVAATTSARNCDERARRLGGRAVGRTASGTNQEKSNGGRSQPPHIITASDFHSDAPVAPFDAPANLSIVGYA